MMNIFKKSLTISSCLALMLSLLMIPIYSDSTYAASCDYDFYGSNDVLFYDPCATSCSAGSGSLTGPEPTSLSGSSKEEKTWNYFISRGLTPIAAAGALGNIEHESGFNPWIGESGSTSIDPTDMGVGFGLIQWTNTDGNSEGRRYGVIKAMERAGINLSNIDQNDESQTDIALLVQLNWLWDGEYGEMRWQEQVNAETDIDGNTSIASYNSNYSSQRAASQTGNGSTMVFHALVERSGDTPTMLQERIDSAKQWLEDFGGGGASTNCSQGETTDVIEMAKRVEDGSIGLQRMDGLKGGITGLDCGDCVAFVSTVYVAAGYPKPFNGSYDLDGSGIHSVPGGNSGNLPIAGYFYDSNNYEIISSSDKRPGDILAWNGHVAIYAGDNNVYEGGGTSAGRIVGGANFNNLGNCNIGGPAWWNIDTAEVIRYTGPPI